MAEIKIEMTEKDFERLTTNSTFWADYWDQTWQEQVVTDGRFENSDGPYDKLPDSAWKMAYWAGEDWAHVMMIRSFLAANGYRCEVLWDQEDDDPQYVVLTNYVGKTWRDFEKREREAEKATGLLRKQLVSSDKFGGLGEVLGFNFAEPEMRVSVRVPNSTPPIQTFNVSDLRSAPSINT